MSVGMALESLGEAKGPHGGNLQNPDTNPQYRKSGLNAEMIEGLPTLHRFEKGDTTAVGQKNELQWHRMAAYMLLAGRTNSEVAIAAGVAECTVRHLRAQRWFQELQAVIANTFGEAVIGSLQSYALEAVEGIHEIATDSELPSRVRLSAFQTLLEQAHGKPIQKIVSNISHSVSQSPEDEMQEIKRELEALRLRDRSTQPIESASR